MTVVCGDSHTSTHGAAGALAHGIGTSSRARDGDSVFDSTEDENFRVEVTGNLQAGATAKDVALAVIGAIGTAGGTGFAIEFCGSAISALSMEGWMTLCNMAIEAGARCGLVAVDEVTLITLETNLLPPVVNNGSRPRRGGEHCVRTRVPFSIRRSLLMVPPLSPM